MRARGAWTAAVALGALLHVGCENARPCEGTCPHIDEAFVVQAGATLGTCSFGFAAPPATLPLSPSRDGRQVTIPILDPSGRQVALVADVLVSEDGESAALLAGFLRTTRAAQPDDRGTLELQVRLDARIVEVAGAQRIFGTLSTWGWPEEAPTGCQVSVPFEGEARSGP